MFSSNILLSLFTCFNINNVLYLEQYCFPSRTDSFQSSFRASNLIQTFQTDWVESLTQSSLVIQKYFSIDYSASYHPSCTSVLTQLSSLTKIYLILRFKSFIPSFLVKISANCRPTLHQSILCILQFSPFLKNGLFYKCA